MSADESQKIALDTATEQHAVSPTINEATKAVSTEVIDSQEAPLPEVPKAAKAAGHKADEVEHDDFSKLLEESENALEQKTYERGMIVEGVIVQISPEFVYVNIGSKAEASIAVSELLNPEDGKLTHVVGDTIKAKVIGFDSSGIKLSRTMRAGNIALEEAFNSGVAVKARVKALNKGGFELDLMGQRAFCPLSQIQKGKIEDASVFVGQSFDFKIIKYAKRGRDIVLSRTALSDEENRIKRDEILATLKVGAILDAKVVSILDYGAFVDVGGLDGLVHVSEISYQHLTHPKELLHVGQDVKVFVLNIEETPKGPKISFSMKKLEDDPFTTAASVLVAGSRLTAKVVRNTNFGSFVELVPGVEGLIHISELTWDRSVKHADEVVKPGDMISVNILSVDLETRRISLSYKESLVNPWDDIDEHYSVGKEITGTLESVTDFGIFVRLMPQLTALLPMSELGAATASLTSAKRGTEVKANILAIDVERKRLTLSTKAEGEARTPLRQNDREVRSEDNEAGRDNRRDANRRDDRRDDKRDGRRNSGSGSGPRSGGRPQEDSSYQEAASFGTFGDMISSLKKKKK